AVTRHALPGQAGKLSSFTRIERSGAMRATTTAACLGVVLIALPCASAVAGHGPARHGTSRHLHISSRFHIVPPIRSEILAQSRFGLQRLRIREPRRFADFGTLLPLGFGVADAPEVMLAAEPL